MATITVTAEPAGRVRPLHGVGQPPFYGLDFSMFHYLTEAGIPYSRLHDVGGLYGGGMFVDIPNLFRDFSADAADPAAYDFTFTDRLLGALVEAGVEPYFRLGVTIENYAHIKAYRIYPPADYEKWARICEGVIRHYTEGWADGFHYPIRYWEIWNEPDNEACEEAGWPINRMWLGSREDFFRLYDTAARHLKACFPHLKIGGYGSCGFFYAACPDAPRHYKPFVDFFHEFMAYCRAHGSPLDFFSWHSYAPVAETLRAAAYVRAELDRYGYTGTESHLNEWNVQAILRGQPRHTAHTAAMLFGLQSRTTVDAAMFYDARFGVSYYGGLFHPLTGKPFAAYYAFAAFGRLAARGAALKTLTDTEGLYAAAAEDASGRTLLLAWDEDKPLPLSVTLPEGKALHSCRLLGDTGFTDIPLPPVLPSFAVMELTYG